MKKGIQSAELGFCVFLFFGIQSVCLASDKHHGENHQSQHGPESHYQGHHTAYHGGVLNVIDRCEIGHIEVRIDGETLEAWFVGGGHDTHRSVPIRAEEIHLKVTAPNYGEKTLILVADPMKLAGEKVGHCSRFSASAAWLRDVNKFEARGELIFKGIQRNLLIKYPEGYDPEHAHEEH
jgi:hypothetical protein